MTSITPAPWKVCCDPGDGPHGSVRVLSAHGCGTVCVVDGTGDEVAANADLVAAAPELLAALTALVAYDEGSSGPDDYGCAVLRRCKAAIAKAEGRASEATPD